MKVELQILESRNDPTKKQVAGFKLGNAVTPSEFALVKVIPLKGPLAAFVERTFHGKNPIAEIQRSELQAMLLLMGREAFDAGVEHGKETQDL